MCRSEVPAEVVSRLMCAVSFGYGVFQLCISLLPPSLLKLIQFLGFGGDRVGGLEALMFSRQGHDMRAPLATYVLLCSFSSVGDNFLKLHYFLVFQNKI